VSSDIVVGGASGFSKGEGRKRKKRTARPESAQRPDGDFGNPWRPQGFRRRDPRNEGKEIDERERFFNDWERKGGGWAEVKEVVNSLPHGRTNGKELRKIAQGKRNRWDKGAL